MRPHTLSVWEGSSGDGAVRGAATQLVEQRMVKSAVASSSRIFFPKLAEISWLLGSVMTLVLKTDFRNA